MLYKQMLVLFKRFPILIIYTARLELKNLNQNFYIEMFKQKCHHRVDLQQKRIFRNL